MLKSPACRPSPRFHNNVSYYAAQGTGVHLGGRVGFDPASMANDAWTWDGANWSQKSPEMPFSARSVLGANSVEAGAPARTSVGGGLTVFSHQYEEPGLMRQEGTLGGGIGFVEYTRDRFRGRAELSIVTGGLDYDGHQVNLGTGEMIPLQIHSIEHILFEGRVTAGKRFPSGDKTNLIPYLGFGARDLSGGFNHPRAYARISSYLYIPIGMEVETDLGNPNGWGLTGRAEYDHFLRGIQTTKLLHIDGVGSVADIKNAQRNGLGARASIQLSNFRENGSKQFGFELFARAWDIGDSEVEDIPEIPGAQAMEPANNTKEFGLNLTYSF